MEKTGGVLRQQRLVGLGELARAFDRFGGKRKLPAAAGQEDQHARNQKIATFRMTMPTA